MKHSLLLSLMALPLMASAYQSYPTLEAAKQATGYTCDISGASGRVISAIKLQDENSTVSLNGIVSATGYHDIRANVTEENIFTTEPGTTMTVKIEQSGDGSWIMGYMYIDLDSDGFSVAVQSGKEAATTIPNGDLMMHNGYSGNYTNSNIDDHTIYLPDGTTLTGNNRSRPVAYEYTFTVPEGLPNGYYVSRFKLDWNCINPNVSLERCTGARCFDFIIKVASAELENPRTVTIASQNTEFGTVSFTNPADATGNTVTTNQANVSFTATAAEGATFMHWLDADNSIVSTTADYTYSGTADASFTAVFGHTIDASTTQGGVINVTVDGTPLAATKVYNHGAQVVATLTPDASYQIQGLTVNGTPVTLDENNSYAFTLDTNTAIRASFVDAAYTLSLLVNGNGSAKVVLEDEFDFDTFAPQGVLVTNGAPIAYDQNYILIVKPFEGEEITAVVIETGEYEDSFTSEDADDEMDGTYIYPFLCAGDTNISVTFTSNGSAIGEIILDGEQGPATYFNLQGMEVSADNLTNGLYIIRRGTKSAKVLIRR